MKEKRLFFADLNDAIVNKNTMDYIYQKHNVLVESRMYIVKDGIMNYYKINGDKDKSKE